MIEARTRRMPQHGPNPWTDCSDPRGTRASSDATELHEHELAAKERGRGTHAPVRSPFSFARGGPRLGHVAAGVPIPARASRILVGPTEQGRQGDGALAASPRRPVPFRRRLRRSTRSGRRFSTAVENGFTGFPTSPQRKDGDRDGSQPPHDNKRGNAATAIVTKPTLTSHCVTDTLWWLIGV